MGISASGATPCFLAKPMAAGVQAPSLSFAAPTGGPNTSAVVASPDSCKPEITTAKRLGVQNTLLFSKLSPASCMPLHIPDSRLSAILFSSPAGNSSTPSSKQSVRVLMMQPRFFRAVQALLPRDLCQPSGSPVWPASRHRRVRPFARVLSPAKYSAVVLLRRWRA